MLKSWKPNFHPIFAYLSVSTCNESIPFYLAPLSFSPVKSTHSLLIASALCPSRIPIFPFPFSSVSSACFLLLPSPYSVFLIALAFSLQLPHHSASTYFILFILLPSPSSLPHHPASSSILISTSSLLRPLFLPCLPPSPALAACILIHYLPSPLTESCTSSPASPPPLPTLIVSLPLLLTLLRFRRCSPPSKGGSERRK